MASPKVMPFLAQGAMNLSPNTFEIFNKPSRSKVWSSAGQALAGKRYEWPVSRAAVADTESRVQREDNPAMSLPVIDLGGLRSGDPAVREKIARELGAATEEWGFVQVVNHGVTDDLQFRMHEQARQFFDFPLDIKKGAEIVGPNLRTFGYKGSLKYKDAGNKEPILIKESLADSRSPTTSLEDLTAKIWSDGNSTFSDTLEEHCCSVEALGHELLELLAESLGVQRDFYSRHFKNRAERTGTWRLHHFPSNSAENSFALRTVPHSDPSVLTLLKQDVGGLQVKKPGGSDWIDVKPLPGSFVVNVGDILEAWSNGRFPSVEHRVSLEPEIERFSMVNFLDARPSLHIECPPELIDAKHPSQFIPFIASDFRVYFEKTKKLGDIRKGKALDYVRRPRPK